MAGADIKELVGEFLSIMGHNVITSTMIGRNTDLQESQDLNNIVEEDDDINTSNWQLLEEPPALEELDLGENPYFERRVGISKNQQERLNVQAGQWWRGAVCPSCKRGFTARSVKKQCHKCDKFTHAKKQCLAMAEDDSVFICKACTNNSNDKQVRQKNVGVLSCKKCNFKSEFKYNLKRHIDNMHDGNDVTDQTVAEIQEEQPVVD